MILINLPRIFLDFKTVILLSLLLVLVKPLNMRERYDELISQREDNIAVSLTEIQNPSTSKLVKDMYSITDADPCEQYLYEPEPSSETTLQQGAESFELPIYCKACKNPDLVSLAYLGD